MTIKNQYKKIKDNWLIGLIILVLVALPFFSGSSLSFIANKGYYASSMADMGMVESAVYRGGGYYEGNFAPEVEDRKITKTTSISNEVERGSFKEAEDNLKSIITSSGSYLLNENVQKYDQGKKSYYSGYYSIKVDSKKYDAVVSQLKNIGEITYFTENAQDVTGRYTDLEVELTAEKERLKRYQDMYDEATDVNDKIQLTDRIFNQEKTISYLENAIENIDKKVEYSTISVTLTEKRSEYIDVIFVKFSELVQRLVNSVNGLLSLVFWIIPYTLAGLLVWLVVRRVREK